MSDAQGIPFTDHGSTQQSEYEGGARIVVSGIVRSAVVRSGVGARARAVAHHAAIAGTRDLFERKRREHHLDGRKRCRLLLLLLG